MDSLQDKINNIKQPILNSIVLQGYRYPKTNSGTYLSLCDETINNYRIQIEEQMLIETQMFK